MAGAAAFSGTPAGPGPADSEDACRWRCPEHGDRVAELFCRRCRRCVCALCPLLGVHRGHPVGLALEEAAQVQVGTRRRAGRGRAREQRTGRGVPRVPLPVPVRIWGPKAAGGPLGCRCRPIVQNERLRPEEGQRPAKAVG